MSSVRTVPVALLLMLGGCVLPHHHARPQRGVQRREEPVRVHVDNQNFDDATIYAYVSGTRFRLGSVVGHREGDFTIPEHPLDVAFEVRLLADASFVTATVTVSPGDRLELVIMPDLYQTHVVR
jgi:hypothetical protein